MTDKMIARNKHSKHSTMKVSAGTVVEDDMGRKWVIGRAIGRGGFGETYAVRKPDEKLYRYALKMGIGKKVFFNELHFYVRKACPENIERFMEEKQLGHLGVVDIHGYGSLKHNGRRYHFLIMTRYTCDLSKVFKKNEKNSEVAVYHVASQMLDIYEFLHSMGYAHGDLKASNIVLDTKVVEFAKAFLIDFGLVKRICDNENEAVRSTRYTGTVKYSSRDIHYGYATRRSDLEVLGFNLIEWLGAKLPWGTNEDLRDPRKVRQMKKLFMDNTDDSLDQLFPQGVSSRLRIFMKYVSGMRRFDLPNYTYLKHLFGVKVSDGQEQSDPTPL